MLIDVVGDLLVDVAERVVGKSAQVHHGVESGEVCGCDVPQIDVERGYLIGRRDEVALIVEAGVEADYFVSGVSQNRDHLHADVPPMSRHQYFHALPSFSAVALLGAAFGPPAVALLGAAFGPPAVALLGAAFGPPAVALLCGFRHPMTSFRT